METNISDLERRKEGNAKDKLTLTSSVPPKLTSNLDLVNAEAIVIHLLLT